MYARATIDIAGNKKVIRDRFLLLQKKIFKAKATRWDADWAGGMVSTVSLIKEAFSEGEKISYITFFSKQPDIDGAEMIIYFGKNRVCLDADFYAVPDKAKSTRLKRALNLFKALITGLTPCKAIFHTGGGDEDVPAVMSKEWCDFENLNWINYFGKKLIKKYGGKEKLLNLKTPYKVEEFADGVLIQVYEKAVPADFKKLEDAYKELTGRKSASFKKMLEPYTV